MIRRRDRSAEPCRFFPPPRAALRRRVYSAGTENLIDPMQSGFSAVGSGSRFQPARIQYRGEGRFTSGPFPGGTAERHEGFAFTIINMEMKGKAV